MIENAYEEDLNMKHLPTGVAVVAALIFSAPVWAQPASPSGGNAVGPPGPNPGGPGLTPTARVQLARLQPPRGDGTSPYGCDAATIFDVGDQLGDAAKASLFASYLAWQDGGASLRQG